MAAVNPCRLRAFRQDGEVCAALMTITAAPVEHQVRDLQEVAARLLQLMDAVETAALLEQPERESSLLLTAKGFELLRKGVIAMAHSD